MEGLSSIHSSFRASVVLLKLTAHPLCECPEIRHPVGTTMGQLSARLRPSDSLVLARQLARDRRLPLRDGRHDPHPDRFKGYLEVQRHRPQRTYLFFSLERLSESKR
jgi:hypothetical protein